jgi:hypothetical protein
VRAAPFFTASTPTRAAILSSPPNLSFLSQAILSL